MSAPDLSPDELRSLLVRLLESYPDNHQSALRGLLLQIVGSEAPTSPPSRPHPPGENQPLEVHWAPDAPGEAPFVMLLDGAPANFCGCTGVCRACGERTILLWMPAAGDDARHPIFLDENGDNHRQRCARKNARVDA